MISRLIGSVVGKLVIGAICLLVLAVALILLGGACWIAFSIWKAVFGFFM